MLKYYYDIMKCNIKKYLLYQTLMIILNCLVVKGCVLAMEEETGYIFPILMLQLLILLQYMLLFLFYQNEIFEKEMYFVDRFIVREHNFKQYQLKRSQLYIHEVSRFGIECIIFIFAGMQKEVFIMLLCINGIGILIENYLYTERWINKVEEAGHPIWKRILSGANLISVCLIFEFPTKEMGFIIGILFAIHTIANKIYIRRRYV